jgi:hypothetical protein
LVLGYRRGGILGGVGQMFTVAITGVCRAVQVKFQGPAHTTLTRRASGPPVHAHGRVGADEPRLIVDSTGLKLRGAGEWLFEKHGTAKRRSWRKLHIGFDADSGEIVAFDLNERTSTTLCMSRPYWFNWPAHQLHSWATALMTGLAFSKAFWREIRTLNSSCLHAKEP